MKRIILFTFAVIGFTIANTVPAMASEPMEVIVDEKRVSFDAPPFLENNRVLVPVRHIAEAMDFKVT